MEHCSEIFVGIDVSKARNAIAVADGERGGEVCFVGEVDASEESMRRVVKRLTAKGECVHFCYEAGPTGYGLHRLITSLGLSCTVVAPALIPRKPGDRVKTNRRDAVALARLLRAGDLTAVWVPDEGHEAMRDLVRARAAAVETQRVHRQQVSSFMLKHGRIFLGRRPGVPATYVGCRNRGSIIPPTKSPYRKWWRRSGSQGSGCCGSRERSRRFGATMVIGSGRSGAPGAARRRFDRGSYFAVEIGDLNRFESPRQLMAYLGLVPSERSTGDTVRPGSITKAGNGRVRHMLVESAWTYRLRPGSGRLSSTGWSRSRRLCARSPGKPRPNSRRVIGPSAPGVNGGAIICFRSVTWFC